jgi:ornithine cyclodeaminase/alanine dehydrogenase-like protein (mu-crystallin family)
MRQRGSRIAINGFEVWSRSTAKAQSVAAALQGKCTISAVDDQEAAIRAAVIVVTATGSTEPLIVKHLLTATR